MEQFDQQMAEIPAHIHLWMNWMMLIFLSSVVFVKNHREARFALLSLVVSFLVGIPVMETWGTVYLLGIAHLIAWTPLMIYLFKKWRSSSESKYQGINAFRIWSLLLMLTIAISLVFDVRDIFLVIQGLKS